MARSYKEFKKVWGKESRVTKQITKIRLKTGEVVPATLWGHKGGDLFGGIIKHKGKTYYLGDTQRNLPHSAFPIKATEKSPFVDFKYRKKRRK